MMTEDWCVARKGDIEDARLHIKRVLITKWPRTDV
jgi:hypothetical protein